MWSSKIEIYYNWDKTNDYGYRLAPIICVEEAPY